LDQALALAEAPHPDLALAQATLEYAQAERVSAGARLGAYSYLDLTPQAVQPTSSNEDFLGDSRARVFVGKPLTDFGRTRALTRSADALLGARERAYLDAHQQRRLDIMERFFDVLLADLRYSVDNETMAHRYVTFDQARDRHELGQLSDIELLQLENDYQEARLLRNDSQARQASARQQLAIALNRPEQLPADLLPPAAPSARETPPLQETIARALAKNLNLTALRAEVQAGQERLTAERARRRPVLSAEAELAQYERQLPSRDDARATLNLRVPLFRTAEDRAAVARAQAQLREQEARLRKTEFAVRQAVFDLIQEIDNLKVARQAAQVRQNYRDLYLDRSRALYELEVRTDLGDAMAKSTEAQWLAAQADYRLLLAWARLDALTGGMVEEKGEGQ
jgi:outer membrane protein TolC